MPIQPLEAVVIGAGERGRAYSHFALRPPAKLKIVACAEPHAGRRERFCKEHDLPAQRAFETWEDLLALPQLAPVMSA